MLKMVRYRIVRYLYAIQYDIIIPVKYQVRLG